MNDVFHKRVYKKASAAKRRADELAEGGITAAVLFDQRLRDHEGGYVVVQGTKVIVHNVGNGHVETCDRCAHNLRPGNDYRGSYRGEQVVPVDIHSCLIEGGDRPSAR